MPKPNPSGTTVISVRIGGRTHKRLTQIAESYDVTVGQLARFVLTGVSERDVKRLLMSSIARIADDDRDDPPEPTTSTTTEEDTR